MLADGDNAGGEWEEIVFSDSPLSQYLQGKASQSLYLLLNTVGRRV